MTPNSTEEVVRAYFSAMEKENIELIRPFFHADILFEDSALGRAERGLEKCMAFWKEYMQAWPWKTFAHSFVFQGDQYAVRWHVEGRQVAELHGMPNRNKTFRFNGASFGTVLDGKIVHNIDYYDLLTITKQLE